MNELSSGRWFFWRKETPPKTPTSMAIQRNYQKPKFPKPRSPILVFIISVACIAFLYFASSLSSANGLFSNSGTIKDFVKNPKHLHNWHDKYLYWGNKIDCPGKHCDSCAGLGHQESSLRCALEEALFLKRTFVMPSRMCINPMHNKKGILHQSDGTILEEGWVASSCAMDSLYDLDLISSTVPVILDNSKVWHQVLSTSMQLGSRGIAHVQGVSRTDLDEKSLYANVLLVNRSASPLSWFMECKDRKNHSSILLPSSFLPSMAAKKLRDAAEKIKSHLGDYDAIHVRRGDILKTRKDRFGVNRSLHPHADRDTHPEFILCRISKWIPAGRTLFIASNERTPGFFSPLGVRYKLAYSSNFSRFLDPLVDNNYELFMVERLVLMGAKTFIRTFKEDDTSLSLTDDPKKNTKLWQIPFQANHGKEC